MTPRPARPGSPNEFCWFDLKTRDPAGTAAFFSKTLGWRFAVDEQDWRKATKISVDGHPIGGVSDLANPVYPPGTPAHIAYYLAVDDVDHRTEAAAANGARVVVPPFDAGDQGRMATLIDPVGAAVSLWQPHRFTGWNLPPRLSGAPHRMTLTCEQPDRARHFYRETIGASLPHADFTATPAPTVPAPQWELTVAVDDPAGVVTRARTLGGEHAATTYEEAGRHVVRLHGPEGLTVRVCRLEG